MQTSYISTEFSENMMMSREKIQIKNIKHFLRTTKKVLVVQNKFGRPKVFLVHNYFLSSPQNWSSKKSVVQKKLSKNNLMVPVLLVNCGRIYRNITNQNRQNFFWTTKKFFSRSNQIWSSKQILVVPNFLSSKKQFGRPKKTGSKRFVGRPKIV